MKRILLFLLVSLLGGIVLPHSALAQREVLAQEDINRIASTVVYIETEERGQPFASGSGTLINSTGMIYTNRHVIEDGDDFHIFLLGDMAELPEPSYYARLVYVSDEIDFAILQIDRDNRGREIDSESLNLPFLPTTTDQVGYGEPIYIFGYPDIGDGYLVLTQGSITTIENGKIGDTRLPIWYRTDAEMSSGNSGGLVVNSRGEYVGIPTWVRKAESTLGQLGGILPFPAIEAVLANVNLEDNGSVVEDQPSGETVNVVIANDSRDTICYLYFSPTTSSDWGTDYLGKNHQLRPGDNFEFEAEPGTYDLKIEDCDNNELDDKRDLVLDNGLTLTYNNNGIEDVPQAEEQVDQTLTVDIQRIEYDAPLEGETETGIMVYAYVRAAGYQGVPLRIAAFYYWANGDPMSGENAIEDNQTPGGNLTVQTTITPEYEDTEWDGFWFWVPYSAFPNFRGSKAEAFVQIELGVEDEDFTAFSDESYFTLED